MMICLSKLEKDCEEHQQVGMDVKIMRLSVPNLRKLVNVITNKRKLISIS